MKDGAGYEKSGVQLAWLGLKDLILVFLPARLGLVTAISGMINWLSHDILSGPGSHDYFPYLLPSLSFSSSTLPSSKNTKFCYSSLSLDAMIMSILRVQRAKRTTPSEDRLSSISC